LASVVGCCVAAFLTPEAVAVPTTVGVPRRAPSKFVLR